MFPAEAVPSGTLVGATNLQYVIAKMEGFLFDNGGHKWAGCLIGRSVVHTEGFDWILNPDACFFMLFESVSYRLESMSVLARSKRVGRKVVHGWLPQGAQNIPLCSGHSRLRQKTKPVYADCG